MRHPRQLRQFHQYKEEHVGVVSGLLGAVAPVDAVIGANLLSEKCVIFDFENKRIGAALDERSKGLD